MHNPEHALLRRVRDGDTAAFARLVSQYLDSVTRFAFYLLHSHDAAEDIAQSVFITLWERRETLENVRSLKSYLFRAVRNRAYDERKANLIRERYRTSIQVEAEFDTGTASIQSDEDALLTSATVQSALRQLPERRQIVLRLRIEDELSHAEIGEILGLSPEAAQRLASRALAELRKILRASD